MPGARAWEPLCPTSPWGGLDGPAHGLFGLQRGDGSKSGLTGALPSAPPMLGGSPPSFHQERQPRHPHSRPQRPLVRGTGHHVLSGQGGTYFLHRVADDRTGDSRALCYRGWAPWPLGRHLAFPGVLHPPPRAHVALWMCVGAPLELLPVPESASPGTRGFRHCGRCRGSMGPGSGRRFLRRPRGVGAVGRGDQGRVQLWASTSLPGASASLLEMKHPGLRSDSPRPREGADGKGSLGHYFPGACWAPGPVLSTWRARVPLNAHEYPKVPLRGSSASALWTFGRPEAGPRGTPGLHPLDARSAPAVTTTNVSRRDPVSPAGQNRPGRTASLGLSRVAVRVTARCAGPGPTAAHDVGN